MGDLLIQCADNALIAGRMHGGSATLLRRAPRKLIPRWRETLDVARGTSHLRSEVVNRA